MKTGKVILIIVLILGGLTLLSKLAENDSHMILMLIFIAVAVTIAVKIGE